MRADEGNLGSAVMLMNDRHPRKHKSNMQELIKEPFFIKYIYNNIISHAIESEHSGNKNTTLEKKNLQYAWESRSEE